MSPWWRESTQAWGSTRNQQGLTGRKSQPEDLKDTGIAAPGQGETEQDTPTQLPPCSPNTQLFPLLPLAPLEDQVFRESQVD